MIKQVATGWKLGQIRESLGKAFIRFYIIITNSRLKRPPQHQLLLLLSVRIRWFTRSCPVVVTLLADPSYLEPSYV